MRLIKDFTQGGQITLHKLRMIRQVLAVTLFTCCVGGGAFFSIKTWQDTAPYQREIIRAYLEASLKTSIPAGNSHKAIQTFKAPSGRLQKIRSVDLLRDPYINQQIQIIKDRMIRTFMQAIMVMGGILAFFIAFWTWRGKIGSEKEVLSGTQVVEAKILKRLVRRHNEASDITLAGVPLIKNKELQHMLIVGTTGSGKSNCIHELLQQVRKKGQRAVIVDITGSFIEKYYRPGIDKILNPLDQRSEDWTIWADCTEPYHYEALSAAFLPSKHEDDFWINSARALFVTTAQKLKDSGSYSLQDFMDKTVINPLHEVIDFYTGTAVASFMNEKADKTAVSVRATLATNIKCLEWLKETKNPFSIRQWVEQEDHQGEWLFLASVPEMREALKPLLTAWTSIATKALMSLKASHDRRLWFVIDELPALKKLPDFHTMLAEARKYGGCAVVGTQDMSLLEEVYGHNLVKSIANLCSTKVVFRIAGADVAERVSKWLGSQEVSESIENISYGAHQMRDGVSLNDQRREKAAINADKLMKLPDLEGYIKLPGNYPVGHIKFKYHQLPAIAESISRIKENG
ncbi:type IV conjugative transfer system coupling protein TraD [Candidatus Odyssella acanthamoebae]|uniref:type IV conjugative transfer system coupling protein TraD n=1 Tax=Candidatus Odyssella acanthamoebae TaxID=91604 RepID=UPI00068E3D38|nr:type IV conjugative transfer system coupling protein TraD [Candidatus Paracaedibacter acanthamoebae]